MKRCTLTKKQENYVRKNYKKMLIYEMALHLGTNYMFLSRNMKFLGLVPGVRAQKKPIPEMSEEHQKFVIRNSKRLTISEMAKELGEPFNTVNKFVKKNKLQVIKKLYKDEPQIRVVDKPVETFVRPPANYSNRQFLNFE